MNNRPATIAIAIATGLIAIVFAVAIISVNHVIAVC
jgi:hypothetical protein